MTQMRVYHWKHGWIPLTHEAALSKAHGSDTGAARILGRLHPVPQEHLPRQSHILAGHSGDGHFTILDTKSNNTTRIHDTLAHSLFANGHTISAVGEGGKLKTTGPRADGHSVEPSAPAAPAALPVRWQKISTEEALGPDLRTEQQRSFDTKYGKRDVSVRERALAKVQQAYRHESGHTILIEPAMSKAKTQDLLDSIHHVVGGAGSSADQAPVRFHVTSGDAQFRSGRTLAYVRQGQDSVFISPKLASGDAEQPKGTDHFMPAHEETTTQRYAIAHELGHVIDHRHQHTKGAKVTAARTSMQGTEAQQLFAEFRGQMSRYGATNPAEAYAEAYAQWHSGQHNAISDAYAAKYGWTR